MKKYDFEIRNNGEYFVCTLGDIAEFLRCELSGYNMHDLSLTINGKNIANVGALRSNIIGEDGDPYVPTLRGDTCCSVEDYCNILTDKLVSNYKIKIRWIMCNQINASYILGIDNMIASGCNQRVNLEIDYYPSEGEAFSDIVKNYCGRSLNEVVDGLVEKYKNCTEEANIGNKKNPESEPEKAKNNSRATASSVFSEVNLKAEEEAKAVADNDFAYDDMQFWWHIDSNNPNPNSEYKDIPNADMRDYENHIDLETAVSVMTREGFEYCLDQKGHMVLRSIANVYDYNPSYKMSPFSGTQFILLDVSDANNIRDMLDEAIIANDPEEADDYNAFGDKAISYERLYDALDGMMSPPPSYQKFAFSLSALLDNIKDYCSHCCNQIDTNTIVTFVVNGSHTPAYSYNDFKDVAVNGKPHYSEYRTVELFRWIDVVSYGIKQHGDIGMELKKFKFAYTGATRGFGIYGQMNNPPVLTIYLDY